MIIAQEVASVRDLNLSMCFPVLLSRSLERLVRGKTREIRKPELAIEPDGILDPVQPAMLLSFFCLPSSQGWDVTCGRRVRLFVPTLR